MESCVAPGLDKFDLLLEAVLSLVRVNQYVFTLSALDPRVYILAYDFDLFSVPVHFNASLYKRMLLFFSIRH